MGGLGDGDGGAEPGGGGGRAAGEENFVADGGGDATEARRGEGGEGGPSVGGGVEGVDVADRFGVRRLAAGDEDAVAHDEGGAGDVADGLGHRGFLRPGVGGGVGVVDGGVSRECGVVTGLPADGDDVAVEVDVAHVAAADGQRGGGGPG